MDYGFYFHGLWLNGLSVALFQMKKIGCWAVWALYSYKERLCHCTLWSAMMDIRPPQIGPHGRGNGLFLKKQGLEEVEKIKAMSQMSLSSQLSTEPPFILFTQGYLTDNHLCYNLTVTCLLPDPVIEMLSWGHGVKKSYIIYYYLTLF